MYTWLDPQAAQRIMTARAEFDAAELAACSELDRITGERYTKEIRRGHSPGFRDRKWSGPPVYEFRGVQGSPEYQKVLQEVRRLCQAQGRAASVIAWRETNPELYRKLVPLGPRPRRTDLLKQ